MDRTQSIDLRDQTIVIGGEGIDAAGRLWLSPRHSSKEWLRVVSQTDISVLRVRNSLLEQIKSEERLTAQSLHIDSIYTSNDLRAQPIYGCFLTVLKASLYSKGVDVEHKKNG